MKDLHVAASPLTGTIYAGRIEKPGVFAQGKQDVTLEALCAVADHVLNFGQPAILSSPAGNPLFKITVEKLDG